MIVKIGGNEMGGFATPGAIMTPDMFIHIGLFEVLFLLALGFFGGMLSGFIGSGGAFVLTPGMMSLGAPGDIAVASNMCHKFPKAMVGAYRRYKIGHLDPKLAIVMIISAVIGVQAGIKVRMIILEALGPSGTDLYTTLAFLIVLPTVGGLCLRDVIKARREGIRDVEPKLPEKLEKKIKIPPIIHFKIAGRRQSLWLTILPGFGTGFLAATIAVGGFIGVPSMIYIIGAPSFVASGTELGIAFAMGSTGSFSFAYFMGAIDFRMTVLILAGSLFGVQIGAVGTTYVRPYFVKLAMGVVMMLVSLSRACALPGILLDLGWISMDESLVRIFDALILPIMAVAFLSVTPIVLIPMMSVRSKLAQARVLGLAVDGRFVDRRDVLPKAVVFGILSLLNYYLLFRDPEWWPQFITYIPHADPLIGVLLTFAVIGLAIYWSFIYGSFAYTILNIVRITALKKEVAEVIAEEGMEGLEKWIDSVGKKIAGKREWPLW
jgi:hypothetical protein